MDVAVDEATVVCWWCLWVIDWLLEHHLENDALVMVSHSIKQLKIKIQVNKKTHVCQLSRFDRDTHIWLRSRSKATPPFSPAPEESIKIKIQ